VEYFWGQDYIISHTPTRVEQGDRLAIADKITYSGDKRIVLLDGNITLAQGSGGWLTDDSLVDIRDADQSRMLMGYSEMHAERAAMWLNNNDFVASGSVQLRQDNRETAADMLAYQDEIKVLTAKGNVKFKDRDGQTFVAGSLMFDNKNEVMQLAQGLSASILLPAKFANDLNQALADAREEPAPPRIEDPPVPDEPSHNPNRNSRIRTPVVPPPVSSPVSPRPPSPAGTPPPIDGQAAEAAGPAPAAGPQPQELILQLGDDEGEEAGNAGEAESSAAGEGE
jgi:hypothetical protein